MLMVIIILFKLISPSSLALAYLLVILSKKSTFLSDLYYQIYYHQYCSLSSNLFLKHLSSYIFQTSILTQTFFSGRPSILTYQLHLYLANQIYHPPNKLMINSYHHILPTTIVTVIIFLHSLILIWKLVALHNSI